MGELGQPLHIQDGALAAGGLALGVEGRAVSAHQSGDVGPGDVAADLLFKGPEHRVIEERTALDHDMFSESVAVGGPDDLINGVFYDADGKARRDIFNGSAVFLGLLDGGIHKDRAAGTQVHGVIGVDAPLGKVGNGIAQRPGKGLQKGAAAGGTGFI